MGIVLWDTINSKIGVVKSEINTKLKEVDFKKNIYLNKEKVNFLDKINIIFTDVEIEGKKKGYEKASKEYELIFLKLENQYRETERLINIEKNFYGNKSQNLIDKLSDLENERDALKMRVNHQVDKISKYYNVSSASIGLSMMNGTLLIPNSNFGVIDIIYRYKDKKMKKAEQYGYLEAKAIYEEKIKKLQNELIILKESGNYEIRKLVDLISDVLKEIVNIQTSITELKILIEG